MRTPSSAFPVLSCEAASSGAWRIALAGLAGAAAGVLAAWAGAWAAAVDGAAGHPGAGPAAWAAGVALVVAVLASVALPVHRARLEHDGDRWRLLRDGAPGVPGQASIALDLGRWLLVRFDAAPTGRAWLPLAAARDPAGWPALRARLWSGPARAAAVR